MNRTAREMLEKRASKEGWQTWEELQSGKMVLELWRIKPLLEPEKVGKDREWGRFFTATQRMVVCLFCSVLFLGSGPTKD